MTSSADVSLDVVEDFPGVKEKWFFWSQRRLMAFKLKDGSFSF